MKREKYGEEAVPNSDEEEQEEGLEEDAENLEELQKLDKSAAYLGYIGKPPKYPNKQPTYGFQRKYLPIKTRVEVQQQKSQSFGDIIKFYQPLIELKNKEFEEQRMAKNIFMDEGFQGEAREMTKDGKQNVHKFVRPYELRLFDLRKQSYTI
jgi:hypothetical protein